MANLQDLSKRDLVNRYRGWNGYNYTNEEKEIIRNEYIKNKGKKNGWLNKLAGTINRSAGNISRYARENGWSDRKRGSYPKIIKRCIYCKGEFSIIRYKSRKTCSDNCLKKHIQNIVSERFKKYHATHIHPKGMLGKTHSPEYRKILSDRVKNAWADKNSKYNTEEFRNKKSKSMSVLMINKIKSRPSSIYSRTTKGWKTFLNGRKYFMRSMWEMNYGVYLDLLKSEKKITDWEYESETFWFEKIKRGIRSYTPDFKIINNDNTIEYHEVKGWMDSKSITKMKRMKKYYPTTKIVIIGEKEYKALKRLQR